MTPGPALEDVRDVGKVRALADDAGVSPAVVEATYRAMIAAFIELELGHHRAGNQVTPRTTPPSA